MDREYSIVVLGKALYIWEKRGKIQESRVFVPHGLRLVSKLLEERKEKPPVKSLPPSGGSSLIEPFLMTPRENPEVYRKKNKSQNQGTSFPRPVVLSCTVLWSNYDYNRGGFRLANDISV